MYHQPLISVCDPSLFLDVFPLENHKYACTMQYRGMAFSHQVVCLEKYVLFSVNMYVVLPK